MKKIEKEKCINLLLDIISAVLNSNAPVPIANEIDIGELCALAKYHNVANIAYYGLQNLPTEVLKPFRDSRNKAMGRNVLQTAELNDILNAFEKEQIPAMPLKGSVIKSLYPLPEMRFMLDIDLYVPEKYFEHAKKIMISLGFDVMVEEAGSKHESYIKKPMINVEIHKELLEEYVAGYNRFSDIKKFAHKKLGSEFIYELSHEDFYLFLITHLHKHYIYGGTGIRSICDVYIYNKSYPDMDKEYIEKELEKLNFLKFAKNVEFLANYWFSMQHERKFDEFAMFFISSGLKGKPENHAINDILLESGGKNISKTRFKYFVRVLFPSVQSISLVYPSIKKVPFLLPFYWLWRAISRIMFSKNKVKFHYNNFKKTKLSNLKAMQNLRDKAEK